MVERVHNEYRHIARAHNVRSYQVTCCMVERVHNGHRGGNEGYTHRGR